MTKLLVSVRSVEEADAALTGGADLIDIKEPARGSLGRPDHGTARQIVAHVAGRKPVSVALGELCQDAAPILGLSCDYAKWGLAGLGMQSHWRATFLSAASKQTSGRVVAVAYADWQRAKAPPPEEVCNFACVYQCGAWLLDTWHKDGSTLLDWLSQAEISVLRYKCRAAGIPVALAGSLGPEQMLVLAQVEPEWFAVRGAVCEDSRRTSFVCADKVSRISEFVHSLSMKSRCGD